MNCDIGSDIVSMNSSKEHSKLIFFLGISLVILITNIVVLVPTFKIFLGLIATPFLSLIPGLLILKLLKFNDKSILDKILLSIGISLSFLLIIGISINFLFPYVGLSSPLSVISLLITLDIIYIVFLVIIFFTTNQYYFRVNELYLNPKEKLYLIIPILFPVTVFCGLYYINAYKSSILLIGSIFLLIVYLFVFYIYFDGSDKIHSIILYLIGLGLLLIIPLSSNYLIGADINEEFYFFIKTLNDNYWTPQPAYLLGTIPSISLLPTIFQLFVQTTPTFLYKFFFVAIYSFTPLIVYSISRDFFPSKYAFASSLLFIFNIFFILIALQGRTAIAIFFASVIILILVKKSLCKSNKIFLFSILSFSLVVTHYTTAAFLLVILILSFFITFIISKLYSFKLNSDIVIIPILSVILYIWHGLIFSTLTFVVNSVLAFSGRITLLNSFLIPIISAVIAGILLFLYCIHLSFSKKSLHNNFFKNRINHILDIIFNFLKPIFMKIFKIINRVITYNNIRRILSDGFLGQKFTKNQIILLIFFSCASIFVIPLFFSFLSPLVIALIYSSQFFVNRFIIIGLIVLLFCMKYFLFTKNKTLFTYYLNINLHPSYLGLLISFTILLISSYLFPEFLKEYSPARLVPIIMSISLILFVIGVYAIFQLIYCVFTLLNNNYSSLDEIQELIIRGNHQPNDKIISILIICLLSMSLIAVMGIPDYLYGSPKSYPLQYILDPENRDHFATPYLNNNYIHVEEDYSAQWLIDYNKKNLAEIRTDRLSYNHLISLYPDEKFLYPKEDFFSTDINDKYIYLGYNNIQDWEINDDLTGDYLSNFADKFKGKNCIYSNGGSMILR